MKSLDALRPVMMRSSLGSPTASVVIPAYNAADHIEDAINSVLAQTYTDYEIIVVNDGSPDTPALEKALDRYRDRIRYLRQDNRGPSGARNAGIRTARGEFIAFLDSDDKWLPEFLESQLQLIASDGQADLVYADCMIFGDSPLSGESFMRRYPSEGPVTLESVLQNRCVVVTSTVVARKRSLMQVGLFNEAYRCCEDFDLWLRLLHAGSHFTYQDRILAYHRKHAESVTAASERFLEAQITVLTELKHDLRLSSRQLELVDRRMERCTALLALRRGKRCLAEKRYGEARQAFRDANRYFQSQKLRLVEYGLRFAPTALRFALTAVGLETSR